MDLEFVEKLIQLVSRSSIGELEIERDGVHIRISRHKTTAGSACSPPPIEPAFAARRGDAAPSPSSAAERTPAAARYSIRAPLTGVFYRSAAESEPPLVSLGDLVEEGQRIGVLEAMKTFNVVESDRPGRIVEITFDDRSLVQAGDVLFILEDAG
jgi:acetyl-CoA carboxylase biotin carboxyl carrier protein